MKEPKFFEDIVDAFEAWMEGKHGREIFEFQNGFIVADTEHKALLCWAREARPKRLRKGELNERVIDGWRKRAIDAGNQGTGGVSAKAGRVDTEND